jgi:hypothetical protein
MATYIKHPGLYLELQSLPYFEKFYPMPYKELVVSIFGSLLNSYQKDLIMNVSTPVSALELLIEFVINLQTKCPTRCVVCFDVDGNETRTTC